MPTTSAKHALRIPVDADPADVPTRFSEFTSDIEAIMSSYIRGTLAARPSASKSGRFYDATDAGFYFDTGSAWLELPKALRVSTAMIIDGAITVAKTGVGDNGLARGAFSAYRAAALTAIPNTAVIFDTEEFDVSGWYDVSNGRFTPQVAGIYRLSARLQSDGAAFIFPTITKNGTSHKRGIPGAAVSSGTMGTCTAIVQANGTTDFFQVASAMSGSFALTGTTIAENFFQGELVGRN